MNPCNKENLENTLVQVMKKGSHVKFTNISNVNENIELTLPGQTKVSWNGSQIIMTSYCTDSSCKHEKLTYGVCKHHN